MLGQILVSGRENSNRKNRQNNFEQIKFKNFNLFVKIKRINRTKLTDLF